MRISAFLRWLRLRCCHLVTLAAYVCAMWGMPFGGFAPTLGCQCGEDLKAVGQCCCAKKLASLSKPGCCETARPVSCCSKSPQVCSADAEKPNRPASCCRSKSAENNSCTGEFPQVSACSCEGKSDTGLLVMSDPRLLAAPARLPRSLSRSERVFDLDLWFPEPLFSPETPPPKAQAV